MRQLPHVVARYWADVCARRDADPAAQAAVLAAVRAHSRRLDAAAAEAAGAAEVTAQEAKTALLRLRPGTAPGPDGIPVVAYRHHAAALAPLLAAVFTALGAARAAAAPSDFLLGAISVFFKAGDAEDPANYRPITLLNADYRILARVLATRFGAVMGPAINPAQCAFLPRRRMGEAVWLLQLLPCLLRQRQREGLLVFLDFSKAYDTVDRAFLFQVMEAMGASTGMVAWASLLLSDTTAVSVVNGYVSPPEAFGAGVRQGCPLSPLLYLFISEALLAWLAAQGHGVDVDGRRVVAAAYADDCTPVLPSMAALPAFDADMDLFGAASGQRRNRAKEQLLRIGEVPRQPCQAYLHGLEQEEQQRRATAAHQHPHLPPPTAAPPHVDTVAVAKTLGVLFANGPVPEGRLLTYWQERLDVVKQRYSKLGSMPLSAFGRAFGATGYGMSRLLFHMEFMGFPPDELVDQLVKDTAALVDRPDAVPGEPCLTGIAAECMPGPPREGGFGLLPLRQHVQARHAWWALTFVREAVTAARPAPWVVAALALLRVCAPAASPLCLLTSPLNLVPELQGAVGLKWPLYRAVAAHPPMQRLVQALGCLPQRVAKAAGASPPPPHLQRDAPLFGNPFFDRLHGRTTDTAYAVFCHGGLVTVQDLMRQEPRPQPLSAWPSNGALARSWPLQLDFMFTAVPREWQRACHSVERRPAAEVAAAQRAAQEAVLQRLVIPARPGASRTTPWPLTSVPPVRVLTAMQLDAASAARRPKQEAFLREAGGPPDYGVPQLLARQAKVWRLDWDNVHKECFWRLPLDAIPIYGAARFRRSRLEEDAAPCKCGLPTVGRRHCFWDCPVALAVRRALEAAAQLSPLAQHLPIRRWHVWLAEPPPSVPEGLWHVVALAALQAMDHGRRMLVALCSPSQDGGMGHQVAPPALLRRVCASAVHQLWAYIATFADLHATHLPRGWGQGVLSDTQPYLRPRAQGQPGLRVAPQPDAAVADVVAANVVQQHITALAALPADL